MKSIVTLLFALTLTASAQLITIPFGTNHYDGSYWWSNATIVNSGAVSNWQGWQAINTNFFLLSHPTNASGTVIDFMPGKNETELSTNASFTFVAYTNAVSNLFNHASVWVTNTSGSPIVATPIAGTITQGYWGITNWSRFDFVQKGTNGWVNGVGVPLK